MGPWQQALLSLPQCSFFRFKAPQHLGFMTLFGDITAAWSTGLRQARFSGIKPFY
jgi:hypothetical protein